MIFVTVGTSLPHDTLIEKIDNLVEDGTLRDKVVAQIGEGSYVPKNFESLRFAPGLERFFDKAEVIVSNCGAGTIMENVTKGRRLVVIQNPDVTGGHEWELVRKMERGGHLIWCKDLEGISECIANAKTRDFTRFDPPQLNLRDILEELGL